MQETEIETSKAWARHILTTYIEAAQGRARSEDYFDERTSGFLMARYEVELGILLEGRLLRHFEGWHMDVEPGQGWLIGMWERQNWEVLEAPCRQAVFFVPPEVLMDLHLSDAPHLSWLLPFTVAPALRPQISPAWRARALDLAEFAFELHQQSHGAANQAQEPQRERAGEAEQASLEQERLAAPLPIVDATRHQAQTRPQYTLMQMGTPLAPVPALQMRLVMEQLLLLLLENWHQAPGAAHFKPFSQIGPALRRALESDTGVQVSEAARLCGLNRNLFSRRFHEVMGVTFSDFCLRRRLHAAARDLLRGNEPVKTIAARWGFASGPYLHRCFARFYGCTPAQYRRRFHEVQQ